MDMELALDIATSQTRNSYTRILKYKNCQLYALRSQKKNVVSQQLGYFRVYSPLISRTTVAECLLRYYVFK